MNIYIGEPVEVSDMQGPCPDGFHVPLNTEWQAIYDAGISLGAWTSSGGTNLSTYLKMPMAGDRSYNRSVYNSVGSYGSYWSSSPYVSNTDYTYYLYFNTSSVYPQGWGYSAYGRTVRCFKDSPTTPTTSWTKLYGTSIESGGIFWSSTDGLISISADGTTWYTLMDKNLGATTVWNSGDTLTDANCGNVFQWGNNYAFPGTLSSASITSSSTRVDASNYGPGNYYSSSTWIEYAGDWSNPSNNNLRGGTDGNVPIMKEAKNIYIGKKPYEGNELCFTAQEANSTVTLNKTGSPTTVTLETSTDGDTWSTYTFGSTITLSNIGDNVYFRNTSETTTAFNIDYENRYSFTMTGSIAGSGDVTTLVNKSGTDTLVGTECFRRLFYNCSSLTSSPELPAKSLTNSCYMQMFSLCTSLTTVPELPATTLADMCYHSMFLGCTALTSAPELPASTMAKQCYYMMFRGCTALTTPPKLSSTALASSCYREMFNGCTSLETLPKLPATTLAAYCYRFMFNNCSKIKLSTTQTGAYQTAYRIPTTGTGTDGGSACDNMFTSTGGTFTGTPSINTTYYTSNTVV